mgnify:CR=1 FL=1|tara:strand:+ start:69 stop:239 length:171 start_codon:yes stop_codon:yes gene_type:complete
MIKLELEQADVQYILDRLGDLPSRSGCFPLIMNIQGQALPQITVPKEEAVIEAEAA